MIRLVGVFLLVAPLLSQAQFTYLLDQSIPVQELKGDQLAFPWAGGINAAQFNTMDLNGDGADDLVVFDRMANKVITFVAGENQYVPAPEYENLFPELANWLLLRDFNCDGKKDIFTGDVLGIKVYRNITTEVDDVGKPEWELYRFSTGFPGAKSEVIQTQGFEFKVNLQLQNDDLPAIADIDGDGDLDILNVQYGGYTVELHQNLSVENYQSCDSLDFKRVTRTWGNFRDCECGTFAFNGQPCPPSTGGRTKHAGGKSLLALDLNGDQQLDLLFSEAECNHLFALQNEGTAFNPVIDNAQMFPPSNPVNFVVFPAAYYEDVDFDGKKDLITTPSIFTKEFFNSNLRESTWLYRNTGSNSSPAFQFVERNFLQKQMIDVGDNAVPAFADYDGDGDYDMLISSHSSLNYSSAVHLYENIGTPSAPAFKLVSDDFMGFSTARLFNLKIQFADMDNNQTLDLVFTATSFDDSSTGLYYFNNKSTGVLNFSGTSLHAVQFGMTSSENVYVTDVNEDGLPDILAGRSEGNLEYWRNSGIAGSPAYTLEDEDFLGFNTSTLRQNLACVAADLDADGKADLAVGDQNGKLSIISDFRNETSNVPLEDIIFSPLQEMYGSKNLGGRIWPTAVNLYNANKPAIAVGNVLGGIHLLKHDEGQSLPDEPQVAIYPNPVARTGDLQIRSDRPISVQVLTVLGQQLSPPVMLRANEVHRYTLPSLSAGLYLLKFTASDRSYTHRLVVN